MLGVGRTDKGGIDWSDVMPSPNDWLGSSNPNSVQWWLMMIRRSQIKQSCAINFSSSALFVYTQRFFYQMDFIASSDLWWSSQPARLVKLYNINIQHSHLPSLVPHMLDSVSKAWKVHHKVKSLPGGSGVMWTLKIPDPPPSYYPSLQKPLGGG